jgi:MoaA/NifB/PqqE/SkfB family radical SAM enzyme
MTMLSIHLTDRCNNRCQFCVVDSPSIQKDLVSRERVLRFLEENAGQGYDGVNIHGGEPTTRRDFLEILTAIRDFGYPTVILQTNGRKLSRADFAEACVGLGVKKFVVSVHGSTSEVHDAITQVPSSLRHAVHGIRNVKALGTHVRTNTVVSQLNYTDVPDIASLIVGLGVDHVNISALHTQGTALKNFYDVTPRYREVGAYVHEAVRRVDEAGVVLTLEGFPFCAIAGDEHHVIDWDHQKFKMLFRNEVLQDYEEYMDHAMRLQGPPCVDCPHRRTCGGVYKEYTQAFGWEEFGEACEPKIGQGGEACEPKIGQGGEACEPKIGQGGEACEPKIGPGGEACEPKIGQGGNA